MEMEKTHLDIIINRDELVTYVNRVDRAVGPSVLIVFEQKFLSPRVIREISYARNTRENTCSKNVLRRRIYRWGILIKIIP